MQARVFPVDSTHHSDGDVFTTEGHFDDLGEGVLVDSFAPGERRREKV